MTMKPAVQANLALIVALARNGVIGRDGQLPWRLPDELQRFKRITMGHALVMGRKTHDSLGRALPGRLNIVVTRQRDYRAAEGAVVTHSIDEALAAAAAGATGEATQVFIIGGAELYAQTLSRCGRLYLTRVEAEVAGDVKLPELDWSQWRLVEEERHDADARHEFAYVAQVWERVDATAVKD